MKSTESVLGQGDVVWTYSQGQDESLYMIIYSGVKNKKIMGDKISLNIRIGNLDDSQATELIRMLWLINHLGRIGASRWLALYADGDGAFRPYISINGVSVSELAEQNPTGEWENWREGKPNAFLFNPD